MNIRKKGRLLAITAAVLWGVMGIPIRTLTAHGLSAIDISTLRCGVTGIVYFFYLQKTAPETLRVDSKGMLISVLYGVTAYSLGFISYSIAVSRIPVSVATTLMFLCPVWVTLGSWIVFREKPTLRKMLSILICITGAMLVSGPSQAQQVRLNPVGLAMGVLNGIGAALQILVPRYYAKLYSRDTLLVYGFLGAAVPLALFSHFERICGAITGGGILVLAAIASVSLLCTMVANIAFVKSAACIPATETSILSSLEIVVGSLAGVCLYHERISSLQTAGIAAVLLGSWISQLPARQSTRRPTES